MRCPGKPAIAGLVNRLGGVIEAGDKPAAPDRQKIAFLKLGVLRDLRKILLKQPWDQARNFAGKGGYPDRHQIPSTTTDETESLGRFWSPSPIESAMSAATVRRNSNASPAE
ncbi:hypothetical protein [Martelella alba]|uniref:hypothetical protein n=1 Tax=Martelella alba TaxID=2590451 RepID=UPI001AED4F1A|nr:hypothetical protein [Martelella alba]